MKTVIKVFLAVFASLFVFVTTAYAAPGTVDYLSAFYPQLTIVWAAMAVIVMLIGNYRFALDKYRRGYHSDWALDQANSKALSAALLVFFTAVCACEYSILLVSGAFAIAGVAAMFAFFNVITYPSEFTAVARSKVSRCKYVIGCGIFYLFVAVGCAIIYFVYLS